MNGRAEMRFMESRVYKYMEATGVVLLCYVCIVPFVCCKIVYGIFDIMF